MSTVEITKLDHVILYHFQRMIQAHRSPQMAFGRLWYLCSNAACRMKEQGIHNPLTDKKEFARQFFEAIDVLCSVGMCAKREEQNGNRTQLISLTLTQMGRERISTIIFGCQERAMEPEVVWNPRAAKRYRGPII